MRRPLLLLVASLAFLVVAAACTESAPRSGDEDRLASSEDPVTCSGEAETSSTARARAVVAKNDAPAGKIAANDAPTRPAAVTTLADVPSSLDNEAVSCPADMVLVDGEFCTEVREPCLEWMDPPNGNLPQHRCKKFGRSVCTGERVHKRFCIEKDEHTAPGETLPQGDISWTDAQKACAAEGKRLCFESEWTFACEGESMLPYPYGYERDATKCNHDKDDLMNKKGELTDHRRPSSELTSCTSPFGVRNMTGNIDEWVFKDGSERQAPFRSALKGGWWLAGRNRCRPATTAHDEYYHGLQTGFRCCKDATLACQTSLRRLPSRTSFALPVR